MDPKIDAKELGEIVEEAARIEEEERAKLSVDDAKRVLAEVDLPASRLEEARSRVAVRRELSRERKQKVAMVVGAMLVALVLAGALGWRSHRRSVELLAMAASQPVLSIGDHPATGPVARKDRPVVKLEVSLLHAPEGAEVDLACDWVDPAGSLRHQNRWQTKSIDHDAWKTHCQRQFGTADAAGQWSVTMRQGERTLADQRFAVE